MKKLLSTFLIFILVVFCLSFTACVSNLNIPEEFFFSDEWETDALKFVLEESFAESEDFSIEKLQDMLADLPVAGIDRLPCTEYHKYSYKVTFDCDSKLYLIYLKSKAEKIDDIHEVDFCDAIADCIDNSNLPKLFFSADVWRTDILEIVLEESFMESEDFSTEKLEDLLADLPVLEIHNHPWVKSNYTLVFDCDDKYYLIYLKSRVEKIDGIREVNFAEIGWETVPNDSYYSDGNQWGLSNIEIEKVWDYATGTSAVRIGIMDSGIYAHDDLISNMDGGYDFYNKNNITVDDSVGHGTFVAGIIGGVGNNEIGISGINWNSALFSLQVTNVKDGADQNCMVEAVSYVTQTYLTDNPIKILNCSVGTIIESDEMKQLATKFKEYPGLIVCSAGNLNLDTDVVYHYPSHYGSDIYEDAVENMIVVGAIDWNNDRSVWNSTQSSNFGERTVDIYAPGSVIYSTSSDNSYKIGGGTSFAAPYVTGVAGLLLSINPDLTSLQLKECILGGADYIEIDVPTSGGTTQTVKKLNALGAFKYMLSHYAPSCTLRTESSAVSFTSNKSSAYYLEQKPMMKLVIPYEQKCSFTVSAPGSSMRINLYDSELNSVDSITDIYNMEDMEDIDDVEITRDYVNNRITVTFTKNLDKGTYYLSAYNTMVSGEINISAVHAHSYDEWSKYSKTHHIESCSCGVTGTVLSNHVIKLGSSNGNYANCMYCGQLINLNDTIVGVPILRAGMITSNGSYILPNGIIVLAEEDIEAYENETLVFYYRDELPEVA